MKVLILSLVIFVSSNFALANEGSLAVMIEANEPEESQITKVEVREFIINENTIYEIKVLYKDKTLKTFRTLPKDNYLGNSNVFLDLIMREPFFKYSSKEMPIREYTSDEQIDPCFSPYNLYSVWMRTKGDKLRKVLSELCGDKAPHVRPVSEEDLDYVYRLRSVILAVAMIDNVTISKIKD
jgi:hypothetical protein